MNEVSCRIFEIFEQPLARKGVGPEAMVAGTAIPLAKLRNKKERIDWAEFVAVMRNMRLHFDDDEFRELGRTHMRSPPLRFAFVIARLLFSAMDFYRWFNKPGQGVGNQLFTCVVPTHRELSSNEIELDLTLPEGYELCWDFLIVTAGNLEELPRLLGLPRSTVTLTALPRGGRLHIVVPERTPLFARLWRLLTSPFTVRSAARELKEAHETLLERFRELEAARATLDRQATQLRTAHAVNDMVQRDLDLARTLDAVARALVEEAGFAWAEIRLGPGDPVASAAARTVRFGGGDGDHEPTLVRALEVQSERIGELEVAPKAGANRDEREELLAFIVPNLAMALQNALSYQALADYRSNLEQLVDQRTGELRQARDQLAGTVVELREAQGARERFFGNITHEIRTPLSLILLATADVEQRAGAVLDERARRNLGAVTDAAHKLVRLVDELLLLAAGQEDKLRTNPERTDLGALLAAVVAAWQPAAEAAGLTLTGPAIASLVASVDPVAIERVASNLVSNAVKYTPRGGSIDVELADEPDGLRFSVLDTGIGMSEELMTRLFGRFEREKSSRHRAAGTGLGLSLTKQLVEAHGGTISARPRRTGSGSELRVVLPPGVVIRDGEPRPAAVVRLGLALVPAAPTGEQTPTVFTPSKPSSGKILLAEDDVRLAEVVARGLADEYTVVIAHDGASALELVARHQPQMLITDVDMPGINGIELSRRFRELTGDKLAPIIVLSAMLDLGTRMAGLEAGAVDYVTKPFDPLELRARIRSQFRMRDLAVRLQRAEQLSAMGILTAGLAHELRNPANGIVNAVGPLVDLLPREVVQAETAVGQLLEVLVSCAEQIGFLSRQLLGFRKGVVDLDLRWVSVRELIQRTVALTHAGEVEIRVDIVCDGSVKCAPPLVTQALTNLLENAIHAAGAVGAAAAGVGAAGASGSRGWVQVRASADEGRLSIELSDSGGGVPIELRERVFEPFFTTKPTGIGTGLGLPLARDIVHRHGGLLEIREHATRTCFVIELPNYSALEAVNRPGMMASPRLR